MQHPFRSLIHCHVIANQPLEQHIIEDALEHGLIAFPCREYGRWHPALNSVDQLSIEFQHGVVVGLDDADGLLGVTYLVDDVVLDLSPVGCEVVVQQAVLRRRVELRVWELCVQLLQQFRVGFLLVQPEGVETGHVGEVLPVLVEDDVLCVVVQVLEHRCAVLDAPVAALEVRRPDHRLVVGHYQFLMVPSPHVPVHVPLEGLVLPLGVEYPEGAAIGLELVDEFLLGPELHVIDEQHHMHASLQRLDHFIQRGIGSRRGVDGVRRDPQVLLAVVDHLPDPFEEQVAVDDELC